MKKTEQKANVGFGIGTLSGTFFTDDLRIGTLDDKSSTQIHIKNQKFGSIEKQTKIFKGASF